jgi:amidohydrolase
MEACHSESTLVEMPAIMGSEDFSYYLRERPGMFFFTGSRNEELGATAPHHHPKFDIDEKAMVYAGKAFLSLVYHYIVEKVEENAAQPSI